MSLFTCCIRKAPDVKALDYRHSGLNQIPGTVFNAERTIETLHIDANQIKALPRVGICNQWLGCVILPRAVSHNINHSRHIFWFYENEGCAGASVRSYTLVCSGDTSVWPATLTVNFSSQLHV